MNDQLDLKQLFDSIGDAIVVADAHERIIFWNSAATRIFGFSTEEALGQTLDLIVSERQRHLHHEGYKRSMETGSTRYGASLLKVPALHKDGRTISIAFTVGMLFDDRQQAIGVVAVIRDETKRFAEERVLKKRIAELENRAEKN
jgi:PAS domain S-box-containing protein